MVKSDGNGSVLVDKKLWGLMIAIVVFLAGLVAYGAETALSDIKVIEAEVHANDVGDSRQEAEIGMLREHLTRIEDKLDKALSRK